MFYMYIYDIPINIFVKIKTDYSMNANGLYLG